MTTSQEHAEHFEHFVPQPEPLRFKNDHLPRASSVNGGTSQPDTPPDRPPPAAPGGPAPPSEPALPGQEQPGDPGPQQGESEQESTYDRDLAALGDMARRGMRYQYACMALLAGYAGMFGQMAHALSFLMPDDLDELRACGEKRDFRAELSDIIANAERALHPQQPPLAS